MHRIGINQFKFNYHVISLTVYDQLSTPFKITLGLSVDQKQQSIDRILGHDITIVIEISDSAKQYYHGMVIEINEQVVGLTNKVIYTLIIVPKIASLENIDQYRIYHQQSIVTIIKQLLTENQIHNFQFHLVNHYPKIEYVTQFGESVFQFHQRICSDASIYYYYEHQSDKYIIHFIDNAIYLPRSNSSVWFSKTIDTMSDAPHTQANSYHSGLYAGLVINDNQIIKQITHRFSDQEYDNQLVMIRRYKPPVINKPNVIGVYQASVIGAVNNEISIDSHGRIKVRFMNIERWVEAAFNLMHSKNGLFSYPCVGDKVFLAFINADPDLPIVIGSLVTQKQNNNIGVRSSAGELMLKEDNILLMAEESLDFSVAEKFDCQVDECYSCLAKEINFTSREIVFQVGSNQIRISDQGVECNAGHVSLASRSADRLATVGKFLSPTQGPILTGSSNILVNQLPLAGVGDQVKTPSGVKPITTGDSSIIIEGKDVALLATAA